LNLLRNENEIFVPHGPQNHENSTKTANFEGFLTHIGHFGAFLLVFLPFFSLNNSSTTPGGGGLGSKSRTRVPPMLPGRF
jgi:hypothetical protein